MRKTSTSAATFLVLVALFYGEVLMVCAQIPTASSSTQANTDSDTAAIEKIVHGNPSDHFAEDGGFTNIFGTVRYGREEFKQRHIQIAQTIFKGTSVKNSIAKLRFVRPDVAIADVSGEMTGFAKVPPGLPVGPDGILRFKLLLVLVKDKGEWWITEYHNVAVTPEL